MAVDRLRRLGAAATLALGLAGGAASAQEIQGPIQKVPLDQTATAGDIEVGCTGIGSDQRDNPSWKSFPVKVMFAGPGGEYLGDEILSVSTAGGRHLATVSCEGPWILLRLAPGRYTVTARPNDGPGDSRSATFNAPRSGQLEVTLRWPTG
jgi:hypothetical protein